MLGRLGRTWAGLVSRAVRLPEHGVVVDHYKQRLSAPRSTGSWARTISARRTLWAITDRRLKAAVFCADDEIVPHGAAVLTLASPGAVTLEDSNASMLGIVRADRGYKLGTHARIKENNLAFCGRFRVFRLPLA